MTPIKAFVTSSARATYVIVEDTNAGSRGVYTVFVTTSRDPVVIGRELSIDDARRVVSEADEFFEGYIGDRKACLDRVKRWVAAKKKLEAGPGIEPGKPDV